MRVFMALCFAALMTACGPGDNYPDAGTEFADTGQAVNVILETDLGKIHVEVYPDKAPLSVRDFLYYVDKNLYDEQGFYRAVTAENDNQNMGMSIVQGGRLDLVDLTLVKHESTLETGLANVTGSLALARGEVGTGSAAFFFINLGDNSMLDHGGARTPDGEGFAVFGRVTKGLGIAYRIQNRPKYEKGKATNLPPAFQLIDDQLLVNPVFIKKAYRKN